ncbi:CBS domain-containing protein [bacterium]|nr:CBS domain-containing protein [bacterium]
MSKKVASVIESKGAKVVTVAPTATIAEVAATLNRNRIGAAPVIAEDGALVGIISERDVIRGIAEHGESVLAFPASHLMTREVQTCAPDDPIVELMETMTLRRIRHLPVIRGGALAGIVSIGDVVKQRLEEAQAELEALRSYIASAS